MPRQLKPPGKKQERIKERFKEGSGRMIQEGSGFAASTTTRLIIRVSARLMVNT